MEYSKDAILRTRYREINCVDNNIKKFGRLKKRISESKFIIYISLLCFILIVSDIILIYNFLNMMEQML